MSAWTATARRLGVVSALGVVILGLLYLMTGVVWMVSGADLAKPIADPYMAVMEILIILSAPLMVILVAAVHSYATPEHTAFSRIAPGFMRVFAGVTTSVHFVLLTVARRIDPAATPDFESIFSFEWPSVAYALDVVAWDLFFGLSLIFAAPVFRGPGLHAVARLGLFASGGLCIAGLPGSALSAPPLQRLGTLGDTVVFTGVCLALAMLFRRSVAYAGGEETSAQQPVATEGAKHRC